MGTRWGMRATSPAVALMTWRMTTPRKGKADTRRGLQYRARRRHTNKRHGLNSSAEARLSKRKR
jgi:hypothetical protein